MFVVSMWLRNENRDGLQTSRKWKPAKISKKNTTPQRLCLVVTVEVVKGQKRQNQRKIQQKILYSF